MTVGRFSDLDGKKFLVTGASSGIGNGVALALMEQGGHVFMLGRDLKAMSDVRDLFPDRANFYSIDLVDASSRNLIVEKLPSFDGVFHGAGIINPFPVGFLNEEKLFGVMDINFTSPVLLTSAMLRRKKINRNASVVFMSSVSSQWSHKGGASYSASKAAIEAYSRTLAIEHGRAGIRANCILAAMVKTPIFSESKRLYGDDVMLRHEQQYPLGFGTVQDVSEVVLFLLSGASRWITGTSVIVDGGLTAGQ